MSSLAKVRKPMRLSAFVFFICSFYVGISLYVCE